MSESKSWTLVSNGEKEGKQCQDPITTVLSWASIESQQIVQVTYETL